MVTVKTSWPWISVVLAGVVTFNPVGLAFLKSAFLAEEALAHNIARPIVLSGAGIMGLPSCWNGGSGRLF